ncbi:MAG: PQQ-binding-like beta-propeller repeat protein [Spirochaetales bacterium]|nr:PQQ-binding-like beta-propeller repeat protein [Spirochaetales bacterium]
MNKKARVTFAAVALLALSAAAQQYKIIGGTDYADNGESCKYGVYVESVHGLVPYTNGYYFRDSFKVTAYKNEGTPNDWRPGWAVTVKIGGTSYTVGSIAADNLAWAKTVIPASGAAYDVTSVRGYLTRYDPGFLYIFGPHTHTIADKTVSLTRDGTAPVVSFTGTSYNSSVPPSSLAFRISDDRAGIDRSRIKVKFRGSYLPPGLSSLDGVKLDAAGALTRTTSGLLVVDLSGQDWQSGGNEVAVEVTDLLGNAASSVSTFTIDPAAIAVDFVRTPSGWANVPVTIVPSRPAGSVPAIRGYSWHSVDADGVRRPASGSYDTGTPVSVAGNGTQVFFEIDFRLVEDNPDTLYSLFYSIMVDTIDTLAPSIADHVPTVDHGAGVVSLSELAISDAPSTTSSGSSGIDRSGVEWWWDEGPRTVVPADSFDTYGRLSIDIPVPASGSGYLRLSVKDYAGNSTIASWRVERDLLPPWYSLSIPSALTPSAAAAGLTVRLEGVEETGTGLASQPVSLSLDGAEYVFVPLDAIGDDFIEFTLSGEAVAEGLHQAFFRLYDVAGNFGQRSAWWIIDSVEPVLGPIAVFAGADPIPEDTYLPAGAGPLVARVEASDSYLEDGVEVVGPSPSIAWSLCNRLDGVGAIPLPDSGAELSLDGLEDGTWYLRAVARDAAGTMSGERIFKMLVDNEAPGPVLVSSSTHPVASTEEDAAPFADASFKVSPGASGPSGIMAFEWTLYDVVGGTRQSVRAAGSEAPSLLGSAGIDLLDLPDNQAASFYELEVSARGGNRRIGPPATYRFRIDTVPPTGLRLAAVPQADENAWYAARLVRLSWNKPADMTGVKEYRYKAFAEGFDMPADEAAARALDLSGWTATGALEASVDVAAAIAPARSGAVDIAVCAIDWSGNRSFARRGVRFDGEAPLLAALPDASAGFAVRSVPEGGDESRFLVWGAPTDPIPSSGLSRVELDVNNRDGTAYSRAMVLVPGADGSFPDSVRIDGLPTATNFRAILRFHDAAGNRLERRASFATEGAATILDEVEDWAGEIAGFLVSGQIRTTAGAELFENFRMETPATLALLARDPSTGSFTVPVETIQFENPPALEFDTLSASGPFLAEVDGFVFSVESLSLDRYAGLALIGAGTLLPAVEPATSMLFPGVKLGSHPIQSANAIATALPAPARLFPSVVDRNGIERTGLPVTDVSSALIGGGAFVFAGSPAILDAGAITVAGVTLEPADEEGGVELAVIEVSPEGILQNAAFGAEPLALVAGGTRYLLSRAAVEGRFITVSESFVDLPEGYSPRRIGVRNFRVDYLDGIASRDEGFSADAFAATLADGTVLTVTSLGLDSSGALLVSGSIEVPGAGSFAIDGLKVGIDGADLASGASVAAFSTTVHGFPVRAVSARLEPEGILVLDGFIRIDGFERPIKDLGLRLADYSVYRAGYVDGSIPLPDLGYGKASTAVSVRIAPEGVFADVELDRPAVFFPDASGALSFMATPLFADGTRGDGILAGPISLMIGGCEGTAASLRFDGARIAVDSFKTSAPSGLEDEAGAVEYLTFEELSLGHETVLAPGALESLMFLADRGWRFAFPALSLDGDGLFGEAFALMPPAFGGYAPSFPDARFPSLGVLDAGAAADGAEVLLGGWPVDFAGATFVDGPGGILLLRDPDANVDLARIGADPVSLGAISLSPDGQIPEAAGAALDPVAELVSANGYRIAANHAAIADGRLKFGGTVRLPDALGGGAVPFEKNGITLYSDGAADAIAASAGVVYSYAGWNLIGNGLKLGVSRIVVPSSDAVYRGISFALGELRFDNYGQLQQGIVQPMNLGLDIFGGAFTVHEFAFDEDGLRAKASVMLPPSLGGYSLFFDPIRLYQDGGFTVESNIPVFEIRLGEAILLLENVDLSSRGVGVGRAEFTLPAALGGQSFRVRGLVIESDGDLVVEDASFDPFEVLGFRFALSAMSIKDGVVDFDGWVELPATLPYGIAGRRVAIDDFRFTFGGDIQAFDIRLQGSYTFPFLESWSLTATDIGVVLEEDGEGKDVLWIAVRSGLLRFPPEFPADAAEVTDLYIAPATGDYRFDKLALTGFDPFTYQGIVFTLDEIAISDAWDVSFSGDAVLPSAGLPAILAGARLDVSKFEILHDGTLGSVDAMLSGLNGVLLGPVSVRNGAVSVERIDAAIKLGVAGDFYLNDKAPEGLQGVSFNVPLVDGRPGIIVDPVAGRLERFAGSATVENLNLFDVLTIESGSIGVASWDAETQVAEFSVSGTLVLPASLPQLLAGKKVTIGTFVFDTTGTIKAFSAALAIPGTNPIIGSLMLGPSSTGTDATVAVALADDGKVIFSLAGKLSLPEGAAPAGFGGIACDIAALRIDSTGKVVEVDATASISDRQVLGGFFLSGASFSVKQPEGGELLMHVAGEITMPSFIPEGLRGPIVIKELTIDSSGALRDLDIGATGLSANIFDVLRLSNGSIGVAKGTGSEFIISAGGDLTLPASLPSGLANATLRVSTLVWSTERGLVDFKAGTISPLTFEIAGGVKAVVTSFELSKTEMAISAKAVLPEGYFDEPTEFVLTTLRMDYSGKVLEVSGGVASLAKTFGGFKATVRNLAIDLDGIELGYLGIKMPDNFGSIAGKEFALVNAGWVFATGDFTGSLTVDSLDADFFGFLVSLKTPIYDFELKQITFERATITTPAFTGGATLALNGVTVSGSGFALSGGEFRLPNFVIPGGLGFRDVFVDFAVYDKPNSSGELFSIAGGGSAVIPGVGTLSAQISFTNRSELYPIGLKRAFFEYTVSGLGLPLGSTGLYLSGIRGGFAFGYPQPGEMPAEVAWMFDAGARLQLGLTMTDQTRGAVLTAKADVWVDVTDWDWAFRADLTVLKGTLDLKGTVVAALTKRAGFYAGLKIELRFVRGRVEIYIYGKDGRTMLAGEGVVQFGLAKGSIYHKTWKILWKRFTINIPWADLWLPGLGAQFGDFSNGTRGVKGYVDVPLFGQIGVFVGGAGTIKIGNVANIALLKPSGAPSATSAAISTLRSVGTMDRSVLGDGLEGSYRFSLPAKSGSITASFPPKFSASDASRVAAGTAGEETPATDESAFERIVFVVAFTEGDPSVVAVSPSGIRYGPEDPAVETHYIEGGMAFAVASPEAGDWRIEVTNVDDPNFDIQVLAKESIPTLAVATPAYRGELAADLVQVSGYAPDAVGGTVRAFATERADEALGVELGSAAVAADGSFTIMADPSELLDGEYFLYAMLDSEPEAPAPMGFAPGSIVLDRRGALVAPGRPLASETAPGVASLSWDDPNGGRTSAYVVIADDGIAVERIDVGTLRAIDLPGYPGGSTASFSVVALDSARNESPASETVTVVFGASKPVANVPAYSGGIVEADVKVGSYANGSAVIVIDRLMPSADAIGFLVASVAEEGTGEPIMPVDPSTLIDEVPEVPVPGIILAFGGDKHAVTASTLELDWRIDAAVDLAPGVYELSARVYNLGNPELSVVVPFRATVAYPAPVIDSAEPLEWNNREATLVTAYGSNFLPGTRAYLDGEELPIALESSARVDISVPAGVAAGERRITLAGPGGEVAGFAVNVHEPYWLATLLVSRAETVPGGTVRFPIAVAGFEGFDGLAGFSAVSAPEFWSVSTPSIASGDTGDIVVDVPASAAAGSYPLSFTRDDGGEPFQVTVVVAEKAPDPFISSMSTLSGFAGDTVEIFGYGFGAVGSAAIGGVPFDILERNEVRIRAVVPAGAVTGVVTVERDGIVATGPTFKVRVREFTLRPSSSLLRLQPGESTTIDLAVVGYSDATALSVSVPPEAPFAAGLDRGLVVPNATVRLSVYAASDAGNGVWTVAVSGSSGPYSATTELTVEIGEAFAVEAALLPEAMEDTPYLFRLSSVNGDEPVSWKVGAGRLPGGLSITRDGVLGGKPVLAGEYEFEAVATDAAGRSAVASLTLVVAENAWPLEGKDGGGTRSNPSHSPADARVAWTSRAEDGARAMAVASGIVAVAGEEGLSAFERKSGGLLYRLEGHTLWHGFAGGSLLTLGSDGALKALDPLTGNERWRREGARAVSTDGALIAVADALGIDFVDAVDGALSARVDGSFALEEPKAWFAGALHVARGDTIVRIDPTGIEATLSSTIPLKALAADDAGLVAVDAEGRLIIIGSSYQPHAAFEDAASPGEGPVTISMDGALIVISDLGGARAFDRVALLPAWSSTVSGNALAMARGKVFVAGPSGLASLKRLDGADIWNGGPAIALALAGGRLYALNAEGRVVCYDAPDNVEPAMARLVTEPAAPDGRDAWFRVKPTLSAEFSDRETTATERMFSIDGSAFASYPGPVVLADGLHEAAAWASDVEGWRGPTTTGNYKVDSTAPTSIVSIDGPVGLGGWYLDATSAALSAADSTSGLAEIVAAKNEAALAPYTAPLVFADDGLGTFRWSVKDAAGNESAGTTPVNVDLYPPVASAKLDLARGLGMATLSATDSASGVARVEYRLDDGQTLLYAEPILVAEAGKHRIDYRAADNAGRMSDWRVLEFNVQAWRPGDAVAVYAEVGGVARVPYRPAHPMMPAFFDDIPGFGRPRGEWEERGYAYGRLTQCASEPWAFGRVQRLERLPRYVWLGDALLLSKAETADGSVPEEKFAVAVTANVYVIAGPESELSGWTLVEEGYPVNGALFPNGARVWARRFAAGQRVILPAGNTGGAATRVAIAMPELPSRVEIRAEGRYRGLRAGEVFTPRALVLSDEPEGELAWSVDWGSGPIAPGPDGAFTAPSTVGARGVLRLELRGYDGVPLDSDEESLVVKRKAGKSK